MCTYKLNMKAMCNIWLMIHTVGYTDIVFSLSLYIYIWYTLHTYFVLNRVQFRGLEVSGKGLLSGHSWHGLALCLRCSQAAGSLHNISMGQGQENARDCAALVDLLVPPGSCDQSSFLRWKSKLSKPEFLHNEQGCHQRHQQVRT